MKTGKIPATVLKRSVTNLIDYKNDSVIEGARSGNGCSVITAGENYVLTSTETALTGEGMAPYFAVIKAVNNIAAAGGRAMSASVAFILPVKYDEKRLKALTRTVLSACTSCGVVLAGGHTEVTDNAACAMVTVTVTGICSEKERHCTISQVKPGMDIVLSKWIALEGTALLLSEHSKELLEKLPADYVSGAADFGQWGSIVREADIALDNGVKYMQDVSEGGIFATLWDVAERAQTGIEIDLKAIPIKQETVEFTEIFHMNPYMMKSSGCLLMITDNGSSLVNALCENGIKGTVIGKTTDNNDKIILNGDEVRYLDKQ